MHLLALIQFVPPGSRGPLESIRQSNALLETLAELAVTVVWMVFAWRAMRAHERVPGGLSRPRGGTDPADSAGPVGGAGPAGAAGAAEPSPRR